MLKVINMGLYERYDRYFPVFPVLETRCTEAGMEPCKKRVLHKGPAAESIPLYSSINMKPFGAIPTAKESAGVPSRPNRIARPSWV